MQPLSHPSIALALTAAVLGLAASAAAQQEGGEGPPQLEGDGDFGHYRETIGDLAYPVAAAWGPDGRRYVVEAWADRVRVIANGGESFLGERGSGPGELLDPSDVAVAPDGTVFVADAGNHRIEAFGADGSFRAAFGSYGPKPGELNDPRGIAVDAERLVVADSGNDRVQVFGVHGEPVACFGSWGTDPGRFNRPLDVALDGEGHVFVADSENHRIQELGLDGAPIASWGDFGPHVGLFSTPSGLAFRGGRLYVADRDNHRIQVFDADGKRLYQWGLHALRPREGEGKLHYPYQVAVSPDERSALVCEPMEGRCQVFGRLPTGIEPADPLSSGLTGVAAHYGERITAAGGLMALLEPGSPAVSVFDLFKGRNDLVPINVTKLQVHGRGFGQLLRPADLALDAERGLVWVCDPGNRRLESFHVRWTPESELAYDPEMLQLVQSLDLGALRGEPTWPIDPEAIELDAQGDLYLADPRNRAIARFTADLEPLAPLSGGGEPFLRPVDVALAPDGGTVYVVDELAARVRAFDRDGREVASWGGYGDEDGKFLHPRGIAVAADGSVYVSDAARDRISVFDAKGALRSAFGGPGLGRVEFHIPGGLAFDSRGRLFAVDFGNHRVQILTPAGEFLSTFGSRLFTRPADPPR